MMCCSPKPPPGKMRVMGGNVEGIYAVKLDKLYGEKWQMDLDYGFPAGMGVRISRTKPGPLTRHNRAHQEDNLAIEQGDWILKANDKYRSNYAIVNEIVNNDSVEIVLKKHWCEERAFKGEQKA
mmetsp:Transcript_41579/g.73063  ORF Transcript_41579/g.73063 Transcript_41579/m.73063 type:complete len:124 (-) Transcript_41579:68-439(-)